MDGSWESLGNVPPAQLVADPRHFQILALAALLTLNLCWIDFGALAIGSALFMHTGFDLLARQPVSSARLADSFW